MLQNKQRTTSQTFEPHWKRKKEGRKLQNISDSKSWPLCSEMLTLRNEKSKSLFPSGLNTEGKRPRKVGSGCPCADQLRTPLHAHPAVGGEAGSLLLSEGQPASGIWRFGLSRLLDTCAGCPRHKSFLWGWWMAALFLLCAAPWVCSISVDLGLETSAGSAWTCHLCHWRHTVAPPGFSGPWKWLLAAGTLAPPHGSAADSNLTFIQPRHNSLL